MFKKIIKYFSNPDEKISFLRKLYEMKPQPKKTKIVGTIGPASENPEVLHQLFQNGLNICRLNFSHGDHSSHQKLVNVIRDVSKQSSEYGRPILMDLKGPSIRTGLLKYPQIQLKKGNYLKITTEYSHQGDEKKISCTYQHLLKTVQVGDTVLVADGNLNLKVTQILKHEKCIETQIMNDYLLRERKNMNLPGNRVLIDTLTEKDYYDLEYFVIQNKIDFVSVSFCRTAQDIIDCRKALGFNGKDTKIVAKIENHEGIYNYESIAKEADVTMIARGDLGMELPLEQITITQKKLLEISRQLLKPVIVATQMLESMTENARPTRAEVSDVTNSIIEGSDCVMLSGETSAGKFPIESVANMRKIAEQSEAYIEYDKNFQNQKFYPKNQKEGLMIAAVAQQLQMGQDIIIVLSNKPKDAQYCSLLRPNAYVLWPNNDDHSLRSLECYSGIYGVKANNEISNQQKVDKCIEFAKRNNLFRDSSNYDILIADCYNLQTNVFKS